MATALGPKLGLLVHADLGDEHYDELTALLRAIDALLQCNVIEHTNGTPPGSPADGDCYIVGPSASGAWATHENKIARWSAVIPAWEFYDPANGWIAFSAEAGTHIKFAVDEWVALDAPPIQPETGFEMAAGSVNLSTGSYPNDTVDENGSWYTSGQGRGYARSSGKRYFEFKNLYFTGGTRDLVLGFSEDSLFAGYNEAADSYLSFTAPGGQVNPLQEIRVEGALIHNDYPTFFFAAPVMFAVDIDNGLFWVGKGGVWYGTGDPAAGTGGISFTHTPGNLYRPVAALYTITNGATLAAHAEAFSFTPPAGFIPWNDPD